MKKNLIKFSEDGTEFVIQFKNGKESDSFDSKKEGFKAITELAQEKKITPAEFTEMRDQILEAEKLEWSTDHTISIEIPVMGHPLAGLSGMLGFMKFMDSMSGLTDILMSPDKPVEVAYFEPCKNCKKHGRIYTKKYFTGDLRSKKQAFDHLTEMKEKNYLSDDEYTKVKAEIEASELSEE